MATPRKPKVTAKKAVDAPVKPEKSVVKGSGPIASKTSLVPAEITYEMIKARAHEIYLSRGCAPGNPEDDWHEAERQLRAGL